MSEQKVKFVEKRTSKNTYQVPEHLAALSVSAIIRAMLKDGWSRYDLSKVTGIRYQHVRNVDITPLKKK